MKWSLLGLFSQTLLIGLLYASDVHSQQSVSVKEVYIHVAFENTSIKNVLKNIESKTQFKFSFDENDIRHINSFNLNRQRITVADLLIEISKAGDLKFKQVDNIINVSKINKREKNKGDIIRIIQTRSINGKVTASDSGEGLPGVNVLEKGTPNGTVTDVQGNYSLEISEGATLVFSSVGYTTEEVEIGNRSTIDLNMTPDVQQLQELVVVGYTTQSKRDLTGAVSSVNVDEISNLPVTNVAQTLQGRVAGVSVSQGGGPGGESIIRIRGLGTTRNNNPLIIIDGVQIQGNSDSKSAGGLEALNPNDIESIQVLKDATSAAIYGARAANGVIIITTKKGKAGKPTLSIDTQYGIAQIPQGRYPDMLSPQQMADTYFQINNPDADPYYGSSPILPDYLIVDGTTSFGVPEGDPRANQDLYRYTSDESRYLIARANQSGTNWMDELLQPGAFKQVNITTSGGGDNGNYLFSAGLLDREGTTQLTDFKRYNFRANTQFSPTDWLRIGENFTFVYNENRGGGANEFFNAMVQYPILPTTDIFGNPTGSRFWRAEIQNPIANLQRGRNNYGQRFRTWGDVYLEADILKNLTFKTDYALNFFTYDKTSYTFPSQIYERQGNNQTALREENDRLIEWVWNNTLTYNVTFDKHNINVLAGTEAVSNQYKSLESNNNEFLLSNIDFMVLEAGTGVQTTTGSRSDWSLWSYFGRLDYSFDDKYLLGAIIRRDATSRFLNNKWGTFPAVSAGWRISQENFMQGITPVTELKIRAGWGQTGNQDVGVAYPGYTTFEVDDKTADYAIDGSNTSVQRGFIRDDEGNPDLRWETTTSTNIGLDVGLFNKLTLSADYWIRETEDMLTRSRLSPQAGEQQAPYINFGKMRNTGFDLQIGYASSTQNDFQYGFNLTATHYKNELISINQDPASSFSGENREGITVTRSTAGQPISSFYVYEYDGIWQSQQEIDNSELEQNNAMVGHFRFKDRNGDNKIDGDDRFYAGNPHPDLSYGLNVNLGYKNFDFLAFFEGVQGRDIYNFMKVYTHLYGATNQPDGNKSIDVLNAWSTDNPNASLPVMGNNGVDATASTYFIEDGSYMRLKNLQLGYNVPSDLISRIGLSRLRVFVQGENIFTFTSYSGVEPEVSVFGRGNDPGNDIGVDAGTLPLARTFLLGANITF